MANKTTLLASSICFLFFLFFYGLTSRDDLQVSDEFVVFSTGISLATRGSLAIDELQGMQDALHIGQEGRGDHLYGKYFPGNVVSIAITYKLFGRQNDQPYFQSFYRDGYGDVSAPSTIGAHWAMGINAFYGALAMAALLILLQRYFDWKTTITTILLIGVCSDWWYQSRGLLSEVGAGAFLIVSLCFATNKKPYLSSFSLAISILFRPTNLVALPIWGFAIWHNGKKAIWSGLFIIGSLLALGFYNWLRFQSPFIFGYNNEAFRSNLLVGLYGILLSPGRSIFVYSPIIALAIPGTWFLYKRNKTLTLACLITVLAYMGTIAIWESWDGGATWGSRLLTPIVPILGFLLAPAIELAWVNKKDLIIVFFLATLGLGVQGLALARDPHRVMVEQVLGVDGHIPYWWTVNTVQDSWIVLQIRSLQNWKLCDIDSYVLRQLIIHCP
jgi:hypothetical protein